MGAGNSLPAHALMVPGCTANAGKTKLHAWEGIASPQTRDFALRREADIERLTDATEAGVDWTVLDELLGGKNHGTSQ